MPCMRLMALAAFLATFTIAVGIGDDALFLLQSSARTDAPQVQNGASLPNVSSVLNKPQEILDTMNTHVSVLEQRLEEVQRQNQEHVKHMKQKYEKNLTVQAAENHGIKRENEKLQAEVDGLQNSIAALRGEATELETESNDIMNGLLKMKANLSTAQEFTEKALNSSGEMLYHSEEMQVLAELKQQDEELRQERDHKMRLKAVGAVKDLSLLEVGTTMAKPHGVDPHGLLEMMTNALVELQMEQNESEFALKDAFEKEYMAGDKKRKALLEEQAALNDTKASSIALEARLIAAVKHLKATRKHLKERSDSLHAFAMRLGSNSLPKPEAVSLLQVDAQNLPNVATVLTKPKEIFESMSTHVGALEQRLADVQRESQEAIAKQKHKYEKNLTAQRDENHAIKGANTKLKADIDGLHQSIARLRSTAGELEKTNRGLVADLRMMQVNISTAQEFTAKVLNGSEDMLHNAPELQVLAELAQKEEELGKQRDRNQRLEAVGAGDTLSLLEVGVQLKQPSVTDPRGLLELMTSALEELQAEQNASEVALKESFENEFMAGAEKRRALLDEQATLNATKASAVELEARIAAAVEHLQETHKQLKERSEALHSYALRLGSKSLPKFEGLSFLQVDAATLPNVASVLTKPKEILGSMNTNVGALEQRLEEVQRQAEESIELQKKTYEKNLTAQRKVTHGIKEANLKLQAEIDVLQKDIAALRSKATEFESQNDALVADMGDMRMNISTAREFTERALNSSDEMLFNAPDVQVLFELKRKDEEMSKERDHDQRLKAVAASKGFSLLEVDMKTDKPKGKDPRNILDVVTSTLEELKMEQQASEIGLKESFEKEYQQGVEKQKALLEEQATLNATKASAIELRARLEVAAKHLEHLHKHLKERSESLHAFVVKMSKKPSPKSAGLSLLQLGAKRSLPNVATVLSKPKDIISAMSSHVSTLEQRLAEVQRENQDAMASQRRKYEKNLTAQKEETHAIKSANLLLKGEIDELQESISRLRVEASELEKKNSHLIKGLRQMRENISTAQEFTEKTLNSSVDMLHTAPELQVLYELAQKEEEMGKERERHQRLNAVGSGIGISLLEVGMKVNGQGETDPRGLLEMMTAALEELQVEQNASEVALKESFEQEYIAGAEKRRTLLEEQAVLNASKANASELEARVAAAVEHLKVTHKYLKERTESLQSFASRLGSKPLPKAEGLSLLQVDAKALPNVATVMEKPKEIFTSMSSHVGALEKRLAEVQRENQEAIAKQKHHYEKNLTAQKEENHGIKSANAQLQSEIEGLHQSIDRLRSTAHELEHRNSELVADLRRLQANISTAEEFTQNALNSSADMLYNASELQVLADLTQKEEEMREERERKRRLKDLSATKGLSLLEVGMKVNKPGDKDPRGLLEMMTAALEELKTEQDASEAALKESFEKEYEAGVQKRKTLLEEQATLNTTKASLAQVRERLAAAVSYLQEEHKKLKDRSHSLHNFALRLGSKPLFSSYGISLLQVDAQKSLPKVDAVMSKPAQIFDALATHVGALEQRLADVQRQNQEVLASKKRKYERNLTAQKDENSDIKSANSNLKLEIADLQESIAGLRSTAGELEEKNNGLVAQLQTLQANITTAQEFTAKMLNSTEDMLFTAPELQVLNELDEEDAAVNTALDHSQRLQAVGSAGAMSLLEMGAKVRKPSEADARGLLEMMASTLDDLQSEQNASEAGLKELFEQQYKAGAEKRMALLEEQSALNATKASALELEARLTTAVKHLQETHKNLKMHLEALHSFALRLGSNPVPKFQGLSLLQLKATRTLPRVATVLTKPKDIFNQMNTNMGALEQSLADVQRRNQEELAAQRRGYEKNLTAQKDENHGIKRTNSQLKDDIDGLQKSFADLRGQAMDLEKKNKNLVTGMRWMQANISVAQEFADKALNTSSGNLYTAPEVEVLSELEQNETALRQEREHSKRLKAVGAGDAFSLLEIGAGTKKPDARGLLEMMTSALDDLAVQQNASKVALEQTFEKEFQAGTERRSELLLEQAELNATKSEDVELEAKLEAAVQHLQKRHNQLKKNHNALRSFAQRLGAIPLPQTE